MPKTIFFLITSSIIFLSSCSDLKDPLDLGVGECYIDLTFNDMVPGEDEDIINVKTVSCSEPHNIEIIAEYSTVPQEYRSAEFPIDETCLYATLDYVFSIHPYADDSSIDKIFTKFDERFSYIFNYNRINDSMEPDLNDYFNCGIISKHSLIIGTFKKTIETFN